MSQKESNNIDNRYVDEALTERDIEKEEEQIKRINKEKNRLKKIIKDLNEETKKGTVGLIDTLAFLRIQIQDLESHIAKHGTKEAYQNGNNQFGYKESTEFKVYNAFLQRYVQFNSQFISLLPPEIKQEVSDGFDEFIASKRKG